MIPQHMVTVSLSAALIFCLASCSSPQGSSKKKSAAPSEDAFEEQDDEEPQKPKTKTKKKEETAQEIPPTTPQPPPSEPMPPPEPVFERPKVAGLYLIEISCSGEMVFAVKTHNDSIDHRTTLPQNCLKLREALHGKTFPSANTAGGGKDETTGGPTTWATCQTQTLAVTLSEGQKGATNELTLKFGLGSDPACLEIRNTINALKI